MSDPPDPLIGTILAERYKILSLVGRGGAGSVYRAFQLQLEREVAVKVVRPDVPEKARAELEARFFREAALAGRLSHPNVVHTIDYGSTPDGMQFVVMELLRGRTVKQAVKGGPLDPEEVAWLGAGIARGLHHAHAKGLVHRDVKASNVFLVTDEEGHELPKLVDFGLVKSVSRELDITQTPTYLGTPLYMSPEQARGELDVDARSDVYSLGCLLYKMVCGEMPFRGETPMATALMHINEPVPAMKDLAPDVAVDPELERIVRRCLRKAPDERWPDAAAVAQALDAWREKTRARGIAAAPSKDRTGALLGVVGVLGVVGLVVGGVAVLGAGAILAWSLLRAPAAVLDSGASPGDPILAAAPPVGGGEDAVAPETDDTDAAADPEDADPGADSDSDAEAGDAAAAAPVSTAPTAPSSQPRAPREATGELAEAPAPAPPAPAADPGPPPVGGDESSGLPADEAGGAAPPVVDGYAFSSWEHVYAARDFVNEATREQLIEAGVNEHYGVVDTILAGRPYATIQAFGRTRGIGEKTVRAVGEATRPR